jgi:Uncharacterized Fe-S protein
MLTVSALYIYPIKSLGGIALTEAAVSDRGFLNDRRWMLIDEQNRFISQREQPQLALFRVQLEKDGLMINHPDAGNLSVPFHQAGKTAITVSVWDDNCDALLAEQHAHKWFSEALGINCRLVYMPDTTLRPVDQRYAPEGRITSFSDAYPFLLIGQASLDDMNNRLDAPVPMNRFRPNIVFSGGSPYQEDQLKSFRIGDVGFRGVKPCARCTVTTVDQQTGLKGKEPLKTLARYRTLNKKIMFGQNLIHEGTGVIRVGDPLIPCED